MKPNSPQLHRAHVKLARVLKVRMWMWHVAMDNFRRIVGDLQAAPLFIQSSDKTRVKALLGLQQKIGGLAVARGTWYPCSFKSRYGKV